MRIKSKEEKCLLIFYFSTVCANNEFSALLKDTRIQLSQQMQKYNLTLATGFAQLDKVKFFAISAKPVSMSSHKLKFFKKSADMENGVNFHYLPFINIWLIKSMSILVGAIAEVIIQANKRRESPKTIICDALNIPLLLAGIIVGRLLRISVVAILTDIPGYYASDEGSKSILRNSFRTFHRKLLRMSDCFVFLNEHMNELINLDNKPFCVIEGQVDFKMSNVDNNLHNKHENMIIMYAGSVNTNNGVHILVSAFINANVNNAELHIYGEGSYLPELKTFERISDKIKVFGRVPNEEVVKKEIEANLLVNPRPTHRAFVKYSFPSKILEYMASGTPVLTTRIPGMPQEYNDYVYYIDNETVDGLTKTLRAMLNKSKAELHIKGLDAKRFVMKEKNNIIQAERIVNMILEGHGALPPK